MIPKTLEEFAQLLDLLRAKRVAELEIGDLRVVLGDTEQETETATENVIDLGPEKPADEERSPATGLTPSEEKDMFYSSE